jgi:hypothetical protein
MKITKVTSNIKDPRGESWSQDLDHLNILIGPNESGKSAIAEAVQLAACGSAYGLFFRSAQVKAGNQLGNLATAEEKIFAEVEYADGSTSRWEMKPGGRPKHTGEHTVALPIGELRSALSGSGKKARQFFAEHLLEPVSREKLEKSFPESAYDLSAPLDKIIPDFGKEIRAADIIEAHKNCGSWKRKSTAKASLDMLGVLGTAHKMDPEHETALMESLCTAIRFEWLRKTFKEVEGAGQKHALQQLAAELGPKEDLKELLGSAQYWDSLRDVWMRESLHRALRKVRVFSSNAATAAEEFDALEKALDAALLSLMAKPLKEYCRRVNKFLPKGDKFGIEHDSSNFRIYLERSGIKHYALSGSAESRTLGAMGAALCSEGGMLILDDRMWDSKNLAKTMERMEKSPCQVLIMSTFKPRGRARSEWNYVEVVPKSYDGEDEVTEAETEAPDSGEPVQEMDARDHV